MADYLIEVYELHVSKVTINDAKSKTDAINRFRNGEGIQKSNISDYLEVAEEYGMGLEEIDEEDADQLTEKNSSHIAGIRSVTEIETYR